MAEREPTRRPSADEAALAPDAPTLAEEQPERHGRVGYGRFGRWTPLLLALAIGAVLAAAWAAERAGRPDAAERERLTGNVAGELAPDVTLTLLDGSPLRLADLRGRVVVLNFWASWCAPCRKEMPILQAFAERERERAGEAGAVVVGVGIRTDQDAAARAFVAELGVTYPVGRDNATDQPGVGPVEAAFGIPSAYPATVFIAPDGRVSRYHLGPISESQLEYAVTEAAAVP